MFLGATAMIATYSGTEGFGTTPTSAFFNQAPLPSVACFLEGTHIETYDGLKRIETLRKGDLVKTSHHGFKPIQIIGMREMHHAADPSRIKDQLYVCSTAKFPEATDSLVLTGTHSLLLERDFKDFDEEKKVEDVLGRIFLTDGMYRFPSCVLEKTHVYPKEGYYNIYHIALEHEDEHMNYGIYANNILVETSSISYMREYSKMKGIEEECTDGQRKMVESMPPAEPQGWLGFIRHTLRI